MSEIIKVLLSLSLSGSILILAVLLLSRLLRDRLSKRWQYYVWLIVVLRLLVPFAIEGSPIGQLFGEPAPVSAGHTTPPAPAMEDEELDITKPGKTTIPFGDIRLAGEPPELGAPMTPSPATDDALSLFLDYLWVPWLAMALILLIRKITLYQSFAKYMRAGKVEVSDPDILNLFGEICEGAGVKRPIELYTNSLIASPLLMGIRKPCVVLPALPAGEMEMRYICLHELTHYQRGDIVYKWLLQVTFCLHWFNPLVHFMVREANRACELSCDEAVISAMDKEERRLYGDVLLESLKVPGEYREGIAALTLSESAALLKERLEAIMKFRKSKKWTAVLAVLLSACLFIGGYALGAYRAESLPVPQREEEVVYSDEGLPIMSAKNREVFESYLSPIAVTGVLRRNWSPEDIGGLYEQGSGSLMNLFDALAQEEIKEYTDGNIPASLVEEILCGKFPLSPEKVREVCEDIYDPETDTYYYLWGLGGGPAVPIVTGLEENHDLLTIYYTWYLADPAADAFRYTAQERGELIVELKGKEFRYRSNKILPAEVTFDGITPDPTELAAERMRQGWDVYWWYYGMDNEGLEIDFEDEVIEPDGLAFRKVSRFATMSELKAATEAVFTKEFCDTHFYSLIEEENLFRETGGALYYNANAGGIGGAYALPHDYALQSEEPGRLVLAAACLGIDEQERVFDLVMVWEDGAWKLDTYFAYTATGYLGDLPLLYQPQFNEIRLISEALCGNLMLGETWFSPWSEQSAKNQSFFGFYCYLSETVPEYPGEIPAEQFESLIQTHFDISTEALRSTLDYNPESGAYRVDPGVNKDMMASQVKEALRIDEISFVSSDTVKVSYRTLWGPMAGSGYGSDSAFEGFIRLRKNDAGFRVLSVTVTADHSDKYE